MNRSYKHILFVAVVFLLGLGIVGILLASSSEAGQAVIEQPNNAFDELSAYDSDRTPSIDTSEQETNEIDILDQETDEQTNNEQASDEALPIENFAALNQFPELATGCEITSLTALLNYYSFPADKCDLADNYLDKGSVGTTDPRIAFVGSPRDGSSYGCYAPVIVTTANRYLSAQGSAMRADDRSGTPFSSLLTTYIDNGIPVIVWGTRYCEQGHYSVTWELNSGPFTWFTPEHCMVLVGYNAADSVVYVADPLEGAIVSYDMDTFASRYNDLKQQAVTIQ
jgi:uncharacterized protein YvpB